MSRRPSVIVIGGGVVGTASAVALARAGARVTVLEPGPERGAATPAAAGMLAPQIEAHAADPLLAFALAARDRYPEFLAQLGPDAAGQAGYRASGIVRVALDEEAAADLAAQGEAQLALGLDVLWLDGDELRRRHPALGPDVRGGLLAPRDGHLHTSRLMDLMRAASFAHGAAWVRSRADAVEIAGGRVDAVRAAAERLRADAVVVAAGAWSARIAGLPRAIPVEPVRGQALLVPAPAAWHAQVCFGPRGYVVPRDEHALLGSTMERVGFDPDPTPDGLATVREGCAAMMPALAAAAAVASWAGLRPLSSDSHPIVGHDPDVTGLFYATGHGRNGILLGPATGEAIADLVMRGETSWPISPYGVDRFAKAS